MKPVHLSAFGFIASLALCFAGPVEAASGNGMITITSDPSGANFSVSTYNGVRRNGVTPATLKNLEPGSYTVTFSPVEKCRLAKPQTRYLENYGHIIFHGDYLCENEMLVTTPAAPTETQPRNEQINVRVWNSFQQSETLAGNSALVTIGVRNISTSTIRNLTLSESFDPSQVDVASVPQGGTVFAQQITWNIPVIYAGQSWTATFPVTMKDTLQTGDTVQLIAHVSGSDIQSPRGELLSQVAAIGIATLPATGAKEMGTIAALTVALLGTITTLLSSRRKKAVALTV